MKMNRALQREILEALAETFPKAMPSEPWKGLIEKYGDDAFRANALYLDGHGLLTWNVQSQGIYVRITSRGLDFLEDDGGLSAMLDVVTVKLHEDTLKELIGQRIEAANLPEPEKHRLLDQLRSLRGETIKHLTLKLVDAGLENWPAALQLIQTFARSHGV
ncbi:hypothetical protein DIE15_08275 [Burkholderia sp. Bp9031]|uniref:hypothetical protein n=1 Tax=Burkholderia sp. Bp9031 TaxID=2184566 RepID=UPI000F5E68F4|nr:hypothetical protein [Burkholderia sp. Bp9031]RQZ18120.1 hypothetical protein DIE15_08275 [Burkholderia sp. Bp9031]